MTLYLQFCIEDSRYLMAASEVVEVIPFVRLRKAVQAPAHIAGLLCYRGASVPVIDLCRLLSDTSCQPRLSSRIVLVKSTHALPERIIGLLVEKATGTRKFTEADFFESGLATPQAPYLAGLARDQDGLLQRLTTESLFAGPELQDLFAEPEPARNAL